ncbi:hypothetical protein GCM10009789_40280 [Kribbella sancticallisti]|uniref:Uncharacterized protein n=1 Tax=Kribbella sancticallisti TaxID=460087 RepID=A0ABN2DPN3_9ACTN
MTLADMYGPGLHHPDLAHPRPAVGWRLLQVDPVEAASHREMAPRGVNDRAAISDGGCVTCSSTRTARAIPRLDEPVPFDAWSRQVGELDAWIREGGEWIGRVKAARR